jgi:hypothetical protein
VWALKHAYSSWHQHQHRKIVNIPSDDRPNQWIDNYCPSKQRENILVVDFADMGMASCTAKILRMKSDVGILTLISHKEYFEKKHILEQYNELVVLPSSAGINKLVSLFRLIRTIRSNKYDLAVFLSDNANSYMRRFPLSIILLSGAKARIVTDPWGNGYVMDKSVIHYVFQMFSHWWKEK